MTQQFSDTELHAYLDGEFEESKRLQIEAFLKKNPEKASEVAIWALQNDTIKGLYSHVAEETIPGRLDPYKIAHEQKRPGYSWQAIAALFALFTLGSLTGWLAHSSIAGKQFTLIERPILQQAFSAHTVYSVEVSHPVEVSGEDEKHLVSWLSKRLKTPLKAPKLKKEGFELIGGRLLPDNNEAAAQFMYENNQGGRITLYLVRNRQKGTTSFRFASYKTMNIFYWMDEKVSYALVGNISRDELSKLSRKVYTQIHQ